MQAEVQKAHVSRSGDPEVSRSPAGGGTEASAVYLQAAQGSLQKGEKEQEHESIGCPYVERAVEELRTEISTLPTST